MRILKSNPVLGLMNSYMVDSPQPTNINYMWNFGSLLGLCLVVQIITGVFLAMNYSPGLEVAFDSVERIMRDVNYGWLIRYMHANFASFFFICVYTHIAKGIYYGSYKAPRIHLWSVGVVIFIVLMATGFLGYTLVYGQMSLWGTVVITNLFSAIPWIGNDLVQLIWGGFSVGHSTINRFFAFHFLFPFVLAALVCVHLIYLHEHGSSNPLGVNGNYDRIPFHPYFIFKDLVTVFYILTIAMFVIAFVPNYLGHSDNYNLGNPLSTPSSIVPEWYFLPFYAILRSIPDKLLGVIAMFGALLILLSLPFLDLHSNRGAYSRPLFKFAFWVFVVDFLILGFIGGKHVEAPFVTIGALATAYYFINFIVIIPLVSIIEMYLAELNS